MIKVVHMNTSYMSQLYRPKNNGLEQHEDEFISG